MAGGGGILTIIGALWHTLKKNNDRKIGAGDIKKTNTNIHYKYVAKKVKKEACITDEIWRKISKISPPERVIFEIFGQISPIMEAFSKGVKKQNKYTQ